jgi:hypothetical protein
VKDALPEQLSNRRVLDPGGDDAFRVQAVERAASADLARARVESAAAPESQDPVTSVDERDTTENGW